MKLEWHPMSELPEDGRVMLSTPHNGKWDIRWIFHVRHLDSALKKAESHECLWAYLPDPPEVKDE